MDLGYQWPCSNLLEDGSVCGSPIRVGKKFCKKCGAQATLPQCPSCKCPLEEPGDRFCSDCGIRIEGVFQPCSRGSSVVGAPSGPSTLSDLHFPVHTPSVQGDASTVAFSDFVVIPQDPSAGSDVSVSSSISQKQPNDGGAYPPPHASPLPHTEGFKAPWPVGGMVRGPQASQQMVYSPEQMQQMQQMQMYLMSMMRYGHPSSMSHPQMQMQLRPQGPPSMGVNQQPPFFPPMFGPDQEGPRFPGPSTQSGFPTPPFLPQHIPNDTSQSENVGVQEVPMEMEGDTERVPEPSNDLNDSQRTIDQLESTLTEDKPETPEPQSSADPNISQVDPDVDMEDAPEVKETAPPTMDSSQNNSTQIGQEPSPGQSEDAPTQSVDTGIGKDSPSPAQTNANIFRKGGVATGVEADGSSPNMEAQQKVFGSANELGGGDASTDESCDVTSKDTMVGSLDEPDAPPAAEQQSAEHKQRSDSTASSSSYVSLDAPRSPDDLPLGKCSPKRSADCLVDVDELNVRFSKLRRTDIPESDSCNSDKAPESGTDTSGISPTRPNEVPSGGGGQNDVSETGKSESTTNNESPTELQITTLEEEFQNSTKPVDTNDKPVEIRLPPGHSSIVYGKPTIDEKNEDVGREGTDAKLVNGRLVNPNDEKSVDQEDGEAKAKEEERLVNSDEEKSLDQEDGEAKTKKKESKKDDGTVEDHGASKGSDNSYQETEGKRIVNEEMQVETESHPEVDTDHAEGKPAEDDDVILVPETPPSTASTSDATSRHHDPNHPEKGGPDVAYRKPADNDEGDEFKVVEGGRRKKKKKKQQNTQTGHKDGAEKHPRHDADCFTVCFYVIVDPEFKCREKPASIIIRFNSELLGGWNYRDHKMQVHRRLDDGYDLMIYTCTIPTAALYRPAYYKYCVSRDGEEDMWEELPKHGFHSNRILTFDQHNRPVPGGIYTQYDGVIVRDKKSQNVFGSVTDWISKKMRDLDIYLNVAIKHMFEIVESDCQDNPRGLYFVQRVARLGACIAGWTLFNEGKRASFFREALLMVLKEVSKKVAEKLETKEAPGIRLGLALAMVQISLNHTLKFELEEYISVFDAFIVHPDPTTKACHDLDAIFSFHFEPWTRNYVAYLVKMVMVSFVRNYPREPRWMLGLPLCHFMSDQCQPFTIPSVAFSTKHEDHRWWGIDGLVKAVDTFKYSYKDTNRRKVLELLEKMSTFYDMDQLLPRSVIACMSHSHLDVVMSHEKTPLDALLGMIHFYVKKDFIVSSDLEEILPKIIQRTSVLESQWLEDKSLVTELALQTLNLGVSVSSDILKFLLDNTSRYKSTFTYRAIAQMMACCMEIIRIRDRCASLYQELYPQNPDTSPVSKRDFCVEVSDRVLSWVFKWLPSKMILPYSNRLENPEEINAWSALFKVKIVDDERTDIWHEQLKRILIPRLENVLTHILDIYCERVKLDVHHPQLIEVVTNLAFKAATRVLSGKDHGRYFDRSLYARIGPIFSRVFLNNWPKDSAGNNNFEEMVMLEHSLTMPSFSRFLGLLAEENVAEILKDDCQHCLAMAISQHGAMLKDLASGNIVINRLNLILKKENRFIENVEVQQNLWTPEIPDVQVLKMLLDARKAELKHFADMAKDIGELIAICESIGDVDCLALDNKCRAVMDDQPLTSICDPIIYQAQERKVNREIPHITFFNLSENVADAMPKILALKDSLIFRRIFESLAKNLNMRRLQDSTCGISVEDLATNIWPKSEVKWNTLCKKAIDGSLTLKETEHYFSLYYDDDSAIRSELEYLCRTEKRRNNVNIRMEEIRRYRQLGQSEEGARIVLQVKEDLELTGDFSILERILGATKERSSPLSSMTQDILDASTALKDFKKPQQDCLSAFIRCKPLVEWLREHVPKAQELKALVDLALIAATGKGDYEVTKVSCLHAAVSGFTPLIYDLQQNAGFKEFYAQCKIIWPTLKSDSKLPRKLLDINDKEMEWLKSVKDAQGDVEVNALKQVALINARGIYHVGHKGNKSSVLMKLEDMVYVVVPSEKDGESQKYSLSNLKELQSKLMLVAGKAEKGKEDVDKFVEIFDGITSLAATFIKICTAGSILFKDWNARFYCDVSQRVNAFVDFGLSKGKLAGLAEHASVTNQIMQIRDFMEGCLGEWKDYIAEQRRNYPELNHYTTEQLVILRNDLTCLTTGQKPPSEKVFALLKDISPECNLAALKEAFKVAITEIKKQETAAAASPQRRGGPSDYPKMEEDLDLEDMEIIDPEQERETVIRKLMGEGYHRKLVEAAIEQFGMEDYDQLEWRCQDLEEQGMFKNDDSTQSEADVHLEDTNILQSDDTLDNQTKSFLDKLSSDKKLPLKGKLRELWKMFLGSASLSVADYLSVQHLGMILQKLCKNEPLPRHLPPYLKSSQPNLIVCAKNEVLVHVLSAYMEDEELPMPRREEVLLCTESTSLEEVELLIWRSVQDKSGRIFMLVNAELLGYEVGGQVERAMDRHMQGHSGYRFVVVCSAEKQDKSVLVAALDNHRVHSPVPQSPELVKQYIHRHLCSDNIASRNLDPENCAVRVVRSDRAGAGKSLWAKRRKAQIYADNPNSKNDDIVITLPLHGSTANVLYVLEALLRHVLPSERNPPRLIHIDIPHEMVDGVDHLLFNLVVLGSLVDHVGYSWQRSRMHYYVIEIMPLQKWEIGAGTRNDDHQTVHQVLDLLPTVCCRSPQESLDVLQHQQENPNYRPNLALWSPHDQLIDMTEFYSVPFQRVYQYLLNLTINKDLRAVEPHVASGNAVECLQILLRYCGLEGPSWAELVHFINFLNRQLESCEMSSFCTIAATSEDTLPGFLKFVIRFMIQMSKDFSTRSLVMAEESPGTNDVDMEAGDDADEEISQFQMKRRWETSPHPYIFFNPDGCTMTFLGFIVQRPSYDVIDAQTKAVLEKKIMSQLLFNGLVLNGVNLNEQFDNQPREAKIAKLCMVMGIDRPHDPDEKYVLTTDNVKKILAIQMRFRCGIPVVIMGETGCGKTQLVKFMCKLQNPPDLDIKNMILMKVHGGTTEEDISRKVKEAQQLARHNRNLFPNMYTVLFLDEVNTTEALGLVKEVLCDLTLKGERLDTGSGLKLIAACNPYRKHSKEVIEMLEKAGLGYHVSAEETRDKLGRIPMRRLVYRVQPLPQSMLPLVWDFGQLHSSVEKMYINKIVHKKMSNDVFGMVTEKEVDIITEILVAAQQYMRNQQDECSFVSLRDVERAMDVMEWFYQQEELYKNMDEHRRNQLEEEARQRKDTGRVVDSDEEDDDDSEDDMGDEVYEPPDDICRSLILAIGVCYHACLQDKRQAFREYIAAFFTHGYELEDGEDTFLENITLCQDVILNEAEIGPNIARNQALKENVFMMVVCIELRIPLFLVGKPGSSKSLARTIVIDSMHGPQSKGKLFKTFKQVYMVSYQCSPLSTPDGIVSTFQQCAQLQKDKQDLDKFVAVVVLDEVGLAEDSPRMPLKTLHPLLEDGCQEDEESKAYKKVGFIGISNWALDPAKMNRGILVQRGPPDEKELKDTAKDICSSNSIIQNRISKLMTPLARGYLDLYNSAITEIREFFGLRDFYSLVKMVHGFSEKNKNMPTWRQLEHAILRNFGGLDRLTPVQVFGQYLRTLERNMPSVEGDPDNSPSGLLRASLCGDGLNCESRYLLLLTENYAALSILMTNLEDMRDAIIIFGSSFPKDQEYTVVCRNINRIKVCMETGQTVVLLNLENLYESLYDALNQYYTYFGGQRHVDLGLGGHRVKSRVHENFKLIVVAEKEVVYQKFPIPLINRLEKHFLAMSTVLTEKQKKIVDDLETWAKGFSQLRMPQAGVKPTIGDSFIGYHQDTCASIVLQVCRSIDQNDGGDDWAELILEKAKEQLLWCATPESVIRIEKTRLVTKEKEITETYFKKQQHESLIGLLQANLSQDKLNTDAFIQVTTHSRTLSNKSVVDIARALNLPPSAVSSQSLQAFNTEQQFSKLLRSYFTKDSSTSDRILIIQCDSGDQNAELIACARYIIWDEYKQVEQTQGSSMKKHVILVIQLPRVTGGCFTGFEGGKWQSVHLDDLRIVAYKTPSIEFLKRHTISSLIGSALETQPKLLMPENEMPKEHQMPTTDLDSSDFALMDMDAEESMVVVGQQEEMEVEEEEKMMEEEKKMEEENADEQLDFNHLVRRCIHSAVSMVKDQVDTGSSTTRINKLFTLFSLGNDKDAVNSPSPAGIAPLGQDGTHVVFGVKEDVPLLGMMKRYAEELEEPLELLRFVSGGRVLAPTDTLIKAGVVNGEYITVFKLSV